MTKNITFAAVSLALSLSVPIAHAAGRDIVNLKTTESGIHQISYQEIVAYGADIDGELINNIALLNAGLPQQIQVVGSTNDPLVFGAGSVVRFVASQLDTLYTDTNVYTLVADASQARRVSIDSNAIPGGANAHSYLATKTFSPQNAYSFTSPDAGDPWHAKRIVAIGQPVSEQIVIALDNVAVGGNQGLTKAKLKVNVWGSTDLPGAGNDHSLKVSFNGAEVAEKQFDGLESATITTELDDVSIGNNTVKITLPNDTGFSYDAVNLNSIEIEYPRKFVAQDNRLDFDSRFSRYRISGFGALPNGSDDILIMRQDASGLSVVVNSQVACRVGCVVTMGGSGQPAHYYLAAKSAIHKPVLDALPIPQNIKSGNAKYLIISHPDFIAADGDNLLENLADELTNEMGSAKVVDVEAIYAQFGNHVFDPRSIQQYIRYAVANLETQYVVLVGGDVYDYRNFENDDARSFIPSLYAATGNNITFAPVDAKYVDLDDDNVPDLPIGRLPVRTTAQLQILLDKRRAYLDRDYAGTALLVADKYDQAQQYDFKRDANAIEAQFLQNFSIEKAYVDDLGSRAARNKITQEINDGVSLTAFFGHSSTNQWSFDGLLTGPDAAGLNNAGRPTVVTQWGCWNAYYVSPSEDSMGHRFMMEGEQGAVAVMGASTLTNADSERKLAKLVFARLANGERLGDAVTNAKQEHAVDNPNDLDVLLGWTVLGLPDLFIN
ncbi:MAG: hypothetical protein ACI9SP_003252 [Arenicella sp.]|jgi:hypothetical protein